MKAWPLSLPETAPTKKHFDFVWAREPGIPSFESPGISLFGYTSTACLQRLSQCSADLGAALVLTDTPYLAQAGHLFQQSMEKAIKAMLLHAGEEPPHSHTLEGLLDLFAAKYPSVGTRLLSRYRRLMERVTPFAVHYRYNALEPTFSVPDLRAFASLTGAMRTATWRFVQTHGRHGEFAPSPFISEWTEDAVGELARRFGHAYRWFYPAPPDQRLLAWLAPFRHAGIQPSRCCLVKVELGKETESHGWFSLTVAQWWRLANGQVLGIELPGEDFPTPGHYLVPRAALPI